MNIQQVLWFAFISIASHAAIAIPVEVVDSAQVDGFVRKCVVYKGGPDRFEATVNDYVAQKMPVTKSQRAWQVVVISEIQECRRLQSYAWEFPEIDINESRYASRREQLSTFSGVAALIVKSNLGARVVFRVGKDVRIRIIDGDPTWYQSEDQGCRLLLIRGGQYVEMSSVRHVEAFLKCRQPNLEVASGRLLVAAVRSRMGLESSPNTQLFLWIKTCSAFRTLEFPALYVFEEQRDDSCQVVPPNVLMDPEN
ncbi:MAG TPA: hypothetical protein VFQ91_14970 [Bryobacteraceae bacterium]|nr:hypothetical protein [Bryobacteraceae bacterium]